MLDNEILTSEQVYAIKAAEDIDAVTVYRNGNKFRVLNNNEYGGIIGLFSKVN